MLMTQLMFLNNYSLSWCYRPGTRDLVAGHVCYCLQTYILSLSLSLSLSAAGLVVEHGSSPHRQTPRLPSRGQKAALANSAPSHCDRLTPAPVIISSQLRHQTVAAEDISCRLSGVILILVRFVCVSFLGPQWRPGESQRGSDQYNFLFSHRDYRCELEGAKDL